MAETYKRWRLPQLWEMVAADDAANAHQHLQTLRRQQTALEIQRDRLRSLRDQLVEGWPPEKSDAATAFVQRINNMIDAMSLTASGAADVRINLNLIVEAIGKARGELAPLVEEYRLTAKVPDQRIGLQARGLLDEHARRILMNTDAAVVEPAAGLNVVLPGYQRIMLATDLPEVPVASGQPKARGLGSGENGRSIAGGFPPPRFDPPESAVGSVQDDTVVLAAENVDRPGVAGLSGVIDGIRPAGGAGNVALLGPGRVLGANPFVGPGVSEGVGVPVRGVIGGGAGGVPAGSGSAGVRGPVVPPVGRAGSYRDSSYEHASHRHGGQGDQDEAWSVPDGVAPVIQPPAIRPHDPGPGVIGIDR